MRILNAAGPRHTKAKSLLQIHVSKHHRHMLATPRFSMHSRNERQPSACTIAPKITFFSVGIPFCNGILAFNDLFSLRMLFTWIANNTSDLTRMLVKWSKRVPKSDHDLMVARAVLKCLSLGELDNAKKLFSSLQFVSI